MTSDKYSKVQLKYDGFSEPKEFLAEYALERILNEYEDLGLGMEDYEMDTIINRMKDKIVVKLGKTVDSYSLNLNSSIGYKIILKVYR